MLRSLQGMITSCPWGLLCYTGAFSPLKAERGTGPSSPCGPEEERARSLTSIQTGDLRDGKKIAN